ncbi:MAG TPA: sugar phosphate nucleotidyltransferase [Candidatus Saccharimonadales bacterium]|nr:sugar phosphate nucleotidyltransferase [Candidatus Saccharimonadales bacterium]
MAKVTKAVIAAAGFGTRFLPQTKAMPKEMLPIVDKPIIQYIVEELVGAGIEDIVIVTGYHKRSIEDHFDQMSADLRENLLQGDKEELLKHTKKISDLANFAYIRQKGPYGNATPLLNAEHLLGDGPFIFAFADDFVVAEPSRFRQLIEAHDKYGGNILTCVEADQKDDYKKYAYVVGKEQADGNVIAVDKIFEKPGSYEKVRSKTASVSGYLFESNLFDYLKEDMKNLKPDQEFIMQPALQRMAGDGHKVWALKVKGGKFYDTGNKLEYMKTVIDFALQRSDMKDEVLAHIKTRVNN